MAVIRRDVAGPSSVSIGMLCLGIAALVIASGLCGAFYYQLRKTQRYRAEMIAQEKRSKIGKPVLQRAPEDVIEASLDLSRMTNEMRQHFAQRRLQPVRVTPTQRTSTVTWSLPESSSGSSGTNSSGPIPTSSSEETNASSRGKSASTAYHSAQPHNTVTPQRPQRTATQSSTPSPVREKRVPRVAVPSALLRGLGDLPQLPAPGAGSSTKKHSVVAFDLDLEKNAAKANAPGARLEHFTFGKGPAKSILQKRENDLEMQQLFSQPTENKVVAGPSPITVDYFSMSSRRNMTPTRADISMKAKTNSGKHSASSSQSSSPYKRPSMELPPLPTMTKKRSIKKSSANDSVFRPLSLGLFHKSSSKSSSLNAVTMFGNLSDSLWSDETAERTNQVSLSASPSRAPLTSTPRREIQEQSVSTSSSKDSTINTALLTESRRGSDATDTTATSANDAYDGASFTKEEMSEVQSTEAVQEETEMQEAEDVPSIREELRNVVTASVYRDGTSFAPFMTPHHRAVFPDQLKEQDDKRNSGAVTPDLSQIHSAPLPPATFPVHSTAPSKAGFASSLRARAKMTLSRAKTISTPSHQPATLVKQAVDPAKKSLEVTRPRADSLIVMAKSPAETVKSYGTVVENWNVDREETTPTLGLGLGLTDGNGKAMDQNSCLGHDREILLHTPGFDKHIGNRASSKLSQYSNSSNFSPVSRHNFQYNMRNDKLGTPPVRHIESAQFGVLSTLSPKYGQSPTMVGNDWMLNRQQQSQHAHKPSNASSTCDTISSCMTGENVSLYDGGKAQDQRAKLLQNIQQGKKSPLEQGIADRKGFFNHTSRSSVYSGVVTQRPATPQDATETTIRAKTATNTLSKNPSNLTVDITKEALLESKVPHTAPLTPPLTPSEQTSLLATAALLQDKTPSREEQTAAKMSKLRPLSLAVQQNTTSPSMTRFKASNNASSSWHRSQYSSASTITAPSASSSNTSLYTSPNRLSTLATSPSRANFRTSNYKSSGVPLGVLPTLNADASPSFLTSTPRIATTPRSPHHSLMTWGEIATPSPRFSRASVNVSTMPYHSPLSTPLRQK